MTSLEKRLDATADLMMRKLDEILRGSNRKNCSNLMENSRQATDGSGTHCDAEALPRSRLLSLTIGRDLGQPLRVQVGRIQSR